MGRAKRNEGSKLKVSQAPLGAAEDAQDSPRENLADLFQSGSTLRRRSVQWLLPGRIVQGSITILEGGKGCGKSTFCSLLAAVLTAGRRLPGMRKTVSGGVLWLSAEEDPESQVRPKLEVAGADLRQVHFPARGEDGMPRRMSFPAHTGLLGDAIRHYGLKLVILDPMSSYLGAETDLNHEGSVRNVLDPLSALAQSTDCTLLLVRHLRKSRVGGRIDHGLGSVAIGAVARSILAIDHPDPRTDRRVLRVVACNLAPRTPGLEYRLDFANGIPTVADLRELSPAADDPDGDLAEPGHRDERRDCRVLLRKLLAEVWVPYQTVLAECQGAGIGERTLRAVKAEFGVRSRRLGKETPPRWEWGPPAEGWPETAKTG
jgi:hypothetical protein